MLNLNRLQILISGLGPKAETQSDNKTLKVLARKESTTGIFVEQFSERRKEEYPNTERGISKHRMYQNRTEMVSDLERFQENGKLDKFEKQNSQY